MRVVLMAALTVIAPDIAAAGQNAPTWRGSDIAATADPISVRELRGREVPQRKYGKNKRPDRPPQNEDPDHDNRFSIGPSITVGAGDYYPRQSKQKPEADQCHADPSGPPSASAAIAAAASVNGSICKPQ